MLRSLPLASSTVALALLPRIGGLGATSISALSQTFAMSQRPAPSSVINPYQKVKPPVVTDQSSLASTASSGGSNGSSSGIANPYAKKRDAPSSSAAAASGTRASSPIDLTSSPASSPVSKKRKAERTCTSSSTNGGGQKGPSKQQQYKIYCDLDGVLVDFDAGIQRMTGSKPHQLPPYIMWAKVASAPDFFENLLGWMADGKELWNSIKGMNPDILTGVPTAKKSRAQKAAWCERELGMPTSHVDMAGTKKAHEVVSGRRSKEEGVVNVITCWSRNKHCESRRGAVLIDDRLSLQQDWVARGGIFIHHTNTRKSLGELRRLGILPSI